MTPRRRGISSACSGTADISISIAALRQRHYQLAPNQCDQFAARCLGIVGEALEGRDRLMQHGQRRPWVLKRKATKPANRRPLIVRGVGGAQERTYAQGIVQVDSREFGGRAANEREVPGLGARRNRAEEPPLIDSNGCSQTLGLVVEPVG